MADSYTQEAKRRCLDLADANLDQIWEDIDNMPEDSDADKWRKKINAIAKEYTFSSRFSLMRIFLNRADESQLLDNKDPNKGFKVILKDDSKEGTIECEFKDISIEHAKELSDEELRQYEKFLMEIASRQSDQDVNEDLRLIRKALMIDEPSNPLTREEALQLGHSLQLTLEEMEWFLLRVFIIAGGFRYNVSDDLIEVYGFLTNASSMKVKNLKEKYEESYGQQEGKKHQNIVDWTLDLGDSLPERVKEWDTYNKTTEDEEFMKWIGEIAPYLGHHSQTALRVYRNLAAYAYNLSKFKENAPDVDTRVRNNLFGTGQTEFKKRIREILSKPDLSPEARKLFYRNGQISSEHCKKIADSLHLDNANLTFHNNPDKVKAWKVMMINDNGDAKILDARMTILMPDGKKKSTNRVQEILNDHISVEKHDMLYLIWFISYICWFDNESNPTPDIISNRVMEFCDIAGDCLLTAGLPAFYPAHLMEQVTMLSIIYAYLSGENNPEEVYEGICDLLIPKKKTLLKCKFKNYKEATDITVLQEHNDAEYRILPEADHAPIRQRSYNELIEERIEQSYKGKKDSLKKSFRLCELTVTLTRNFFDELSLSEQQEIFIDCIEFAAQRYGRDNIIATAVHLNEIKPHLHIEIIPMTQDGKLSAKGVIGGPEKKQEFQDKLYSLISDKYAKK